ncbi:hypothetical protein [Marmoricola sp. RAF53]|uniref:hypothetical protein n=1 Tax=Marmoricola sp. RAF53 TaxID=3233059 RepID=UPI003F9AD11F
MARRVFLHIGTPKSGTTYLQDRLALNRDLIARQGLTYVQTRTGDHFEAALDLIEERWAGQREVARGQWAALVAEARKAPGDVLVSHEILAAAKPAQVRKAMAAFAGDEVHVVLTARDLARQIPAEWQEGIKHRGRRSFHGFMREITSSRRNRPRIWFWRVQSLPDILTRWGNGLPPERIHVVTVPPPGSTPDALWRRFAGVVGLDPDGAYEESTRFNASLGVVEANVVRRLNKLLVGREVPRELYIDLVRDVVVRDTLGERADKIPVVIPQVRWAFVDRVTAEWREWIEGAGVDVVGSLDDLEPEHFGPDHTWVHPDQPPADLVAEAALESLAAVIAQSAPGDPSRVRRLARRLLGG